MSSSGRTESIDNDGDDDPVVATYDVYFQPHLPENHKLFILQYPGRSLNREPLPTAIGMRVKRNTGLVAVDIPLDVNRSYDRQRGMDWGATLQKVNEAKDGGGHGFTAGFNAGALPIRSSAGGGDVADISKDWAEAIRTDSAVRTTVHSGYAAATTDVNTLVGVFTENSELHLTPITSIVSMRPDLHHVDATAEWQQRKPATGEADEQMTGGAASGTVAKPARAVQMQAKPSTTSTIETTGDRLRAVQQDKWTNLSYTSELDSESWAAYDLNLLVHHSPQPLEDPAKDSKLDTKGKGKAEPSDDLQLQDTLASEKPVKLRAITQDSKMLLLAVVNQLPNVEPRQRSR